MPHINSKIYSQISLSPSISSILSIFTGTVTSINGKKQQSYTATRVSGGTRKYIKRKLHSKKYYPRKYHKKRNTYKRIMRKSLYTRRH